jgi:hypothetical protein
MSINLRSPYKKTGGIVYFGRMLDKMRLHVKGELSADYTENLGVGFDERCVNFLHVSYSALVDQVKAGASDEAALAWCFENGRQPNEEEIEIWNEFMRKRGWNDEASERLQTRIEQANFNERTEILTMFDFIDADEGRR